MPTYRYLAVKYIQQENSSPVFLFAAPCHEITGWAGIPRKEAKEGVQTVGFQRSPDRNRLKKLKLFLGQKDNIVANPILCATKIFSRISFDPLEQEAGAEYIGWLTIEEPDYRVYSLVNLFKAVEELILQRLPRLEKEIKITEDEIAEFCRTTEEISELSESIAENEIDNNNENEEYEDEEDSSIEFSSESHIEEFFRAVRLRRIALEVTGTPDRDNFAGFSKEALKDYLHAVTLVDGQHRLLGAQAQLNASIKTEESMAWQDELLSQGISASEVLERAKQKFARQIGIALIHNDDWAEHVFQFVVVNQKATPIQSALLGSIIATTLTDDEVSRITDRLGRADINVADYQTIAFLSSSPRSPFYGLIKRGYDEKKESEKKIDWSVVDRLVKIFRYLQNGKYFHNRSVDFAKKWRKSLLDKSGIVQAYQDKGFEDAYSYWKHPKGPWLDVFLAVWTQVRDQLAVTDDPSAPNIWGYPKKSNIFNDLHLSILGADFFAFLGSGRGIPIDSVEHAPELAKEWLDGAKASYFARDYGLEGKGVKKSEGAVRGLWSKNWYEYRENGYQTIKAVEKFRP